MTALVRYEAALVAIAACAHVDEVKDWADKAAAMQAYSRMAKDKTLEVQAAEIRIRAERRLGELILAQKETVGLSRGAAGLGINQHTPAEVRSFATTAPKLSDAGISKDLSARAQALAKVPDAEFEQEMADWRDRTAADGARVSARLVARGSGKKPKPEAVDVEALKAEIADLKEANAELAATAEELLAENTALQKVVDSEDRITAALAEAKTARQQMAQMQSRIDGLMNERNALVRQVKAMQRAQKAAA